MPVALDTMLVSTPDTCGGKLRIDGARITVHQIATLYKQGQTADDVVQTYPHLSYEQLPRISFDVRFKEESGK